EALRFGDAEPVEHLLVADGPERADRKHLRLAAGEEATAVRTGQHVDLAADRPDLGDCAVIRPQTLLQDVAADDLLLEPVEGLPQRLRAELLAERDDDLFLEGVDRLFPRRL